MKHKQQRVLDVSVTKQRRLPPAPVVSTGAFMTRVVDSSRSTTTVVGLGGTGAGSLSQTRRIWRSAKG